MKLVNLDDAQDRMYKGIKTLSEAVGATLGPLGRNIALDVLVSVPDVVHDGATVARAIESDDPFENIGIKLAKEAALSTDQIAGDGTTTSTILMEAMISEGRKLIENNKNPMKLRKGMEIATKALVDELDRMAIPVDDPERIATISAQDAEIGKIVAEAVVKVGAEGTVALNETDNADLSVEYSEGMEFDKGYMSQAFINTEDKCVLENPYILFTDYDITQDDEIMPILEEVSQETKNLIIIADRVEGQAMATILGLWMQKSMNVLCIFAPGFAQQRFLTLEDMATMCGGKVISKENGSKLSSVSVKDLGNAEKVVSGVNKTVIVGGKGEKEAISERVETLRRQIKEGSAFDKTRIEPRLAKLTGGVAVINIGAATESAKREKIERVRDAVAATKAAIAEGIVPGGAIALIRASKVLDESIEGVEIVKKALYRPFIKLMDNSGIDKLEALKKVNESEDSFGIDVMDEQLKDLLEAGIIDPVKVTKSALINAAEVAGTILTTVGAVADKEPDGRD